MWANAKTIDVYIYNISFHPYNHHVKYFHLAEETYTRFLILN